MTSEQCLQSLEICGVACSQASSVADGDRGDHQVDTALASGGSCGGGDKVAQLAVDVRFTSSEREAVAIVRPMLNEFDGGVGSDGRVRMCCTVAEFGEGKC